MWIRLQCAIVHWPFRAVSAALHTNRPPVRLVHEDYRQRERMIALLLVSDCGFTARVIFTRVEQHAHTRARAHTRTRAHTHTHTVAYGEATSNVYTRMHAPASHASVPENKLSLKQILWRKSFRTETEMMMDPVCCSGRRLFQRNRSRSDKTKQKSVESLITLGCRREKRSADGTTVFETALSFYRPPIPALLNII